MKNRYWVLLPAAALVSLACMGGGGDRGSESSDVEVSRLMWDDIDGAEQGLAAVSGIEYWARGNDVDVCYVSPIPSAAIQTRFQSFINNSWGRSANLNIKFNGACPSNLNSNWVSVLIDTTVAAGSGAGVAGFGRGARLSAASWARPPGSTGPLQMAVAAQEINVSSPSAEDIGIFRNASIHEFGHVLGYYHETNRGGQDNCGNGSGTDNTGWLTVFDQHSVMNACMGTVNGSFVVPGDQNASIRTWRNQYYFSPLDALGAEVRLPRSANSIGKLWCGAGCIMTGSGVIISGNTSAILNEWVARGAANVLSSFTVGPNFDSGGTLAGTNVSDGSSVTNTAGIFPANIGGGNVLSSGTVVKSAGKYTAAMMSSVGVLV